MLGSKLVATGGGESKGEAVPPPKPPPVGVLASFRPVEFADNEEEEKGPDELSTLNLNFLKVTNRKLSVTYVGGGAHGNDVGAVQGNRPVPQHCLVYYFEITVKDRGERGCVGIGFADRNFKVTRQPGWEPGSYGYHGDDGKIYHAQGRGLAFGPTFTTGDVVGAGINHGSQEIFFTKNGKMLGTAFREVRGELFPTVGLHSKGEAVDVNFGGAPFEFDLEALLQEEKEKRQRAVETVPLPLKVSHSVVRDYLMHYGYLGTLRAFDTANGAGHSSANLLPDQNGSVSLARHHYSHALDQRKHIRQLIREGNIEGAELKLLEWYPKVLQDSSTHVAFMLSCQKFVELMRVGQLEEAVAFARAVLAHHRDQHEAQDAHLQDCLALLAYERADESLVGYLYSSSQREVVADVINAAILLQEDPGGTPQSSVLEKLLRQLIVCHSERRIVSGGQGEVFRLHRVLGGTSGG